MQYPCATIKTKFAIQQNEPLMDSGSNMKHRVVICLCSTGTSCDVRLKLAHSFSMAEKEFP